MKVDWDPVKAESNLSKHGISFDEAVHCLLDPQALAREDRKSEGEARWILIGMSDRVRLLTVVYSLRGEDHTFG